MIPAEIGGGFGGKTIVYLEPLAILLSKKSGRPVKMVMTREEVFRASGPTSGSMSKVKIGAKKDGTIVAAQARSICRPAPSRARRSAARRGCSFAPYDIPNVLIRGFDVVCNRPKVAAYRAPGAPIGAFAVECVIDELAGSSKMDPLDLRLKNAAKEGTKAAHGPTFPHRLRRDAGGRQELRALRDAARQAGLARSGPRRRLRLLVQRRRRISSAGPHHRGRHRRRDHGPSRHRRLARLASP